MARHNRRVGLSGRRRETDIKILWTTIAALVLTGWLLILYIPFFKNEVDYTWAAKIQLENSRRYETYYQTQNLSTILSSQRIRGESNWAVQRQIIDIYESLSTSDQFSNIQFDQEKLVDQCSQLSEIEMMHHEICRAFWLHVLAHERIVGVGHMLGFPVSEHKLGAMQIIFANKMRGWFKPCGLMREHPENEIIASSVDFILGFNRAPPAVMRNISVSFLEGLIQQSSFFHPFNKKYAILGQIAGICSDDGMLRGSVIGWIDGLQDGISLPKTRAYWTKYKPELNVRVERLAMDPWENAEEVNIHILLYLLNILRTPGKNEFVYLDKETGHKYFLAVDLDRTKLDIPTSQIPTFREGCVFSERTVTQLQKVFDNYDEFVDTIQKHTYTVGRFYLSTHHLRGLYDRISATLDAVTACKQKYSDNVIIPSSVWKG